MSPILDGLAVMRCRARQRVVSRAKPRSPRARWPRWSAVQARLDRLERAGVVTGYGPDIDLEAAGYGFQAFVSLEIAQGAPTDVAAELTAPPAVLEASA